VVTINDQAHRRNKAERIGGRKSELHLRRSTLGTDVIDRPIHFYRSPCVHLTTPDSLSTASCESRSTDIDGRPAGVLPLPWLLGGSNLAPKKSTLNGSLLLLLYGEELTTGRPQIRSFKASKGIRPHYTHDQRSHCGRVLQLEFHHKNAHRCHDLGRRGLAVGVY